MTASDRLNEHSTFAGRLRWAIRTYGPRPRGRAGAEGSIRAFTGALQSQGIAGKGASYQMVHRYLKEDGPQPPADFVAAAAAVLAPVRAEWLGAGEGAKTTTEANTASKESLTGAPHLDEILAREGLSPSNQHLQVELWQRYMIGIRERAYPPGVAWNSFTLLTRFLDIPNGVWGFNHKMSERQRNDFARAMLHALMIALPETNKGDELEERGVAYSAEVLFPLDDDHVRKNTERIAEKVAKLEAEIAAIKKGYRDAVEALVREHMPGLDEAAVMREVEQAYTDKYGPNAATAPE